MTTSVWATMRLSRPEPLARSHEITAVTFTRDFDANASPMTCACGWQGTVEGWPAHVPNVSQAVAWSDVEKARNKEKKKATPGPSLPGAAAQILANPISRQRRSTTAAKQSR
ncbi:MAG: hypothetical protein ABI725_04505 [Chloroflexota bacterium]